MLGLSDRGAMRRLFDEHRQVTMYVSSGLLPSTGFFSETSRRIGNRLLPEVIDTTYLKDLLSVVFHRVDDEVWVNAIADADWLELLRLLAPLHKLVFSRTRHGAERLSKQLNKLGVSAEAIHGDRSQSQREALAERINMPTEKWSRLESTNRMTMAPSCCSPKASSTRCWRTSLRRRTWHARCAGACC